MHMVVMHTVTVTRDMVVVSADRARVATAIDAGGRRLIARAILSPTLS
jgi:hypothetical protein